MKCGHNSCTWTQIFLSEWNSILCCSPALSHQNPGFEFNLYFGWGLEKIFSIRWCIPSGGKTAISSFLYGHIQAACMIDPVHTQVYSSVKISFNGNCNFLCYWDINNCYSVKSLNHFGNQDTVSAQIFTFIFFFPFPDLPCCFTSIIIAALEQLHSFTASNLVLWY